MPEFIILILLLEHSLITSSKLLKFIVIYLIPFEVEKSPTGFSLSGSFSRTRIFIYPDP